jgi:hypothetical protein
METKLEKFVLSPEGLKWIEKMPDENEYNELDQNYQQALQYAIDSAVKVDDVNQLVIKKIYGQDGFVDGFPENFYSWIDRSVGKIYSMHCRVEKLFQWRAYSTLGWINTNEHYLGTVGSANPVAEKRVVAFITFDQKPEQKSSQHEVEYPGTVRFSMKDPDWLIHNKTERCQQEQPHHISECKEFDKQNLMTTEKQNLYKVSNRLGNFYVIASDPTAAQTKLETKLDKHDHGFSKDRKVIDIYLVAEQTTDDTFAFSGELKRLLL